MRGGRALAAQATVAAAAGPCQACGADDWQATRPGWRAGLGQWLTQGGPWRPVDAVCGRCGTSSGQRSALFTARPWRWWSAPVRVPWALWQALRYQRTAIPSPAVYLGAAAVGSLLGLLGWRANGWPWWPPPVVVVVGVWLVFAATAIVDPGNRSQAVAAVLGVLSPTQAQARLAREEAERAHAAAFPLYGLPPAWSGLRHLAGTGWSQMAGREPAVTQVGLGHGNPWAWEPTLTVTMQPHITHPGQTRWEPDLAEQLWTAALQKADPLPTAPDAFLAALAGRRRTIKRRPAPVWQRRAVLVDGRPVAFEWLAEGRHWVARGEIGEVAITMEARDVPVDTVELVRVTDLQPYVEGARQLRAALAQRHTNHAG